MKKTIIVLILSLTAIAIILGLIIGFTYLEQKVDTKKEIKYYKTLQTYFPKVYTLKKAEQYIAVDSTGNIHLVNYHPYNDDVIIQYGEITEAITTKDVINLVK